MWLVVWKDVSSVVQKVVYLVDLKDVLRGVLWVVAKEVLWAVPWVVAKANNRNQNRWDVRREIVRKQDVKISLCTCVVGWLEGSRVGWLDGCMDGSDDGFALGCREGSTLGCVEG